MTNVTSKKCETCAQSHSEWDIENGRTRFFCTLDLMGVQPCKSYSREPGVEG